MALLAVLSVLLGMSPFSSSASTNSTPTNSTPTNSTPTNTAPSSGPGLDVAVRASARLSAAASSIDRLPDSRGAMAFRLQRAVLVRQLVTHGGPQLAVNTGPVVLPTAALLELERLVETSARGVLRFVRPGRGPPQQAGS